MSTESYETALQSPADRSWYPDVLERLGKSTEVMTAFWGGLRAGIFVSVLGLASGCATRGAQVNDVQQPLSVVKNVVSSYLPGGVRKSSPNGRELWSGYFNPEAPIEDGTKLAERAYLHALVLGSRRPYVIEIRVYRERRQGRGYIDLGPDERIAKDIARRIQKDLANRREDRSIIDDFRAF